MIAAIIIFVMGVTMLKMDRSKAKWRVKLERAFESKSASSWQFIAIFTPFTTVLGTYLLVLPDADKGSVTGKWVLFFLPLITVLREGMEAVVFVGGVSLGQPATSIPIATIVGIICGLIIGYFIYAFASRTSECFPVFQPLKSYY